METGGKITLLEEGTTGLGMFKKLPFIGKGSIQGEVGKDYVMICYTDGA